MGVFSYFHFRIERCGPGGNDHNIGFFRLDQCPIYNDAFAPSKEEIERARSIIDAAEDARSMGRGTASAAGTQIDAAVEKSARRLLELADFAP